MNFISETIDELKNMKPRKLLAQVVTLGMVIASAFAIWKSLMVITCSESPVVVVLTGSMEPAYYRGDILFLSNYNDPVVPGDVVVFKLPNQDIPIVHRAVLVQEKEGNDFYMLTKGDNNNVDDRPLYAEYGHNSYLLSKKELMGKVRAYLPYIGYVTIMLNDYPMLKYVVIGLMSILVLVAKDPQN
eukprot:TRINITY_DN4689_c0_g1_i2.p1 TRINITY_DN4689_c0_g1~~TRINITY_DN4689_c0_g1_i2.p1  ORF type:complete len:186 (-),score=46.96 TRINITY_DN4689_c0_g1_i2:158-715(-)